MTYGDPVQTTILDKFTPPTAGTVSFISDDDDVNLTLGNAGGTGDIDRYSRTVSSLDFSFGTATTGSIDWDSGQSSLISGAAGTISIEDGASSGILLIKQTIGDVTTTIATLELADDGTYTVTQNAALKHASGADENDAIFAIAYTVAAGDEIANGTLNLTINDDTPIKVSGALQSMVLGNTAPPATGSLGVKIGADVAGSTLSFIGITNGTEVKDINGNTLKSGGQNLVWKMSDSTPNVIEAVKVGTNNVAFTATLSIDQATGLAKYQIGLGNFSIDPVLAKQTFDLASAINGSGNWDGSKGQFLTINSLSGGNSLTFKAYSDLNKDGNFQSTELASLNSSTQGIGVNNSSVDNKIDNSRTSDGAGEMIELNFSSGVSSVSLKVDQLTTNDTLKWVAYAKDGITVVGSNNNVKSTTNNGSSSSGDDLITMSSDNFTSLIYSIKLTVATTDSSGNGYRIKVADIIAEKPLDSTTLSFGGARIVDGDGDAVETGSFAVTFAGLDGTNSLYGSAKNEVIAGTTSADKFIFSGFTQATNGTDLIKNFESGDKLALLADGTSAGTLATADAIWSTVTSTNLDLGNISGKDVIEFTNLNSGNGDLSVANDGVELLKLFSTIPNASLSVVGNNVSAYLVAYDNDNAYIYNAQSGSDNIITNSEIQLIGVVEGVGVGALKPGDIVMG